MLHLALNHFRSQEKVINQKDYKSSSDSSNYKLFYASFSLNFLLKTARIILKLQRHCTQTLGFAFCCFQNTHIIYYFVNVSLHDVFQLHYVWIECLYYWICIDDFYLFCKLHSHLLLRHFGSFVVYSSWDETACCGHWWRLK